MPLGTAPQERKSERERSGEIKSQMCAKKTEGGRAMGTQVGGWNGNNFACLTHCQLTLTKIHCLLNPIENYYKLIWIQLN